MSSNRFETNDWADRHRRNLATRHTHQDALTNREFERLLKACEQLPEPEQFEARLMAGRLGLRAGEIAHTTIEWIAALIILFVVNAVLGLGVGVFGVPAV